MLTPNVHLKNRSGIYALRNVLNNKVYVGKTKDPYRRCYQYLYDFREKRGDQINEYLMRSMVRHGLENFEMFMLEFCDKEMLAERELFWMDELQSCHRNFGYNLRRDSSSGMETHENTSRKISNRLRQEWKDGKRKTHAQKMKNSWANDPDRKVSQSKLFSSLKTKWSYYVECEGPFIYRDLKSLGIQNVIAKFALKKSDVVTYKGLRVERRPFNG